ncbi:hypothetical protein SRHO_G00294290 [Serrasalmus rhombeus]
MLGVDLMGPLPKSPRQNEYLLIMVDYCSKWVEMFPLRTARAPQIARILVTEVFTRWGTPAYLVSDRGAQFTSHLIHETCREWGVVQKLTTAYHPQTNLTERINRTVKTMIASYVRDKHRLWDRWLSEFRFAINSAWQESTGFTPAEVALGRKLKGPLERLLSRPPDPEQMAYKTIQRQQDLIQQVQANVEKAQAKQARHYNRRRKTEEFSEGDLVWVRTHPLSRADMGFTAKLAGRWSGPAKIIKKLNPVNYQITYPKDPKLIDTVHIEHLKSHVKRKDYLPLVLDSVSLFMQKEILYALDGFGWLKLGLLRSLGTSFLLHSTSLLAASLATFCFSIARLLLQKPSM